MYGLAQEIPVKLNYASCMNFNFQQRIWAYRGDMWEVVGSLSSENFTRHANFLVVVIGPSYQRLHWYQ